MKKTKRCRVKHCFKLDFRYKQVFEVDNVEQLLQIMNLYLSDWQQRMIMYWNKNFSLFFADVVITILPFTDLVNKDINKISVIWLFPVLGFIMTLFYYCVVVCDANRLTALSEKYKELQSYLPKQYRWKNLNVNVRGIDRHLNMPLIKKVSICMTLVLMLLNIYVFVVSVVAL